jgi:hypothetical protein
LDYYTSHAIDFHCRLAAAEHSEMEPFLDFSSNPLICRTHCRLAAEIRRTAPSSTTGLLLLHLSAEMVTSKQHMFWDQAIALHAASQHAVHSILRKLLLVRKGKDKRESVLRSYYAGPLTDDAWQLVRVYSLTCCQRHCQNPERRRTMKALKAAPASTGPHHHRAESSPNSQPSGNAVLSWLLALLHTGV